MVCRWNGVHEPDLDPTAASFEPAFAPERPTLDADKIDLLPAAAICTPESLVDDHTRDMLARIADIFPDAPIGLASVRIGAREQPEYLRVLAAMHGCGKLRFMHMPSGVASFFVVGRATKDRQRPIWNGADISAAWLRAPLPPRLRNPAAFRDVRVADGKRLCFSKRDAI